MVALVFPTCSSKRRPLERLVHFTCGFEICPCGCKHSLFSFTQSALIQNDQPGVSRWEELSGLVARQLTDAIAGQTDSSTNTLRRIGALNQRDQFRGSL